MKNEMEKEIENKLEKENEMESTAEGETYVTKMPSTKKTFAKWILCWICLGFLFLFFSNIFMHLFSYESSDIDKNILTFRKYENCKIGEDGQYINTDDNNSMQLFYSVEDLSEEISKIYINFDRPLDAYIWVELYYPDEQGTYKLEDMTEDTAENMIDERLVPGLKEHVIDVEPGKYSEIRLDFDQPLYIKEVCAGETGRRILYADKVWRYRIWGISLLFSLILSVLLFCSEGYRIWWGKACRKVLSSLVRLYEFIDFKKLILTLFGSVIFGGCLEALAMRLLSGAFNAKETIVFVAMGFLLFFLYAFQESYIRKWERNAVGIFLFLGLAFIYVMPVSVEIAWDEDTHYYGMVSMARLYQGTITEADDMFIAKYSGEADETKIYQRSTRKQDNRHYDAKYQNGAVIETKYGFSYKHISYLPFAVGIWIAYGLGLPFCAMASLVKMCNLLFIGLLLYASMKNLQSGKLLLLAFAMIPTVFFLVVSYSYDSWLIFLLIYAFSRYFRELQRRKQKLTFKKFLGIFVPALLALLPKIVYAPMLFLMAYMPKSKWKEKRWETVYYACFVCAALLMVFGICYVASGQLYIGSDDRGIGADGDRQLQYMIHHFGTYCHTLFTFLRNYLSYNASAEYLTDMYNMGMLPIQYITIMLLLITAFWDRSFLDRKTIPVLSKLAALIMPGIIAAICATAMYLVFTEVGADYINGCQGRYLLPAIFPTIYMLSRCGCGTGIRGKISIKNTNIALIGLNACFLLFNLWIHCASRY